VAFRDVTPERMRRPLSVLVVNWRKIPITLVDRGRKCCPELFLRGASAGPLHKTQGAGHPNLILIG
jgi:hypothetical protein